MKHFGIYRKLILIIGTATAVVSVGVFFFMEDILFRTLFISFAFVFLCGLLFLMDFLHNRYNDNLLEEITLLIEALVEQQERMVFSEAEDTLTARLQHQLLKLRIQSGRACVSVFWFPHLSDVSSVPVSVLHTVLLIEL